MTDDNSDLRRLHAAFLHAFPTRSALGMLVGYELKQNLDAIASDTNLDSTIFELLRWAQANGRLDELLQAACRVNPIFVALTKEALDTPEQLAITSEDLSVHEKRSASPLPTHKVVALYFSYVHEETWVLTQIEKHLSMLKRSGSITVWHKGMIRPGENEDVELAMHLNKAHIILLLVSPDFLASERTYTEAVHAMQRVAAEGIVVIPIICRPTTDWQATPFGALVSLPFSGKALAEYSGAGREKSISEVAMAIRSIIENSSAKQT